jgi:hypothetical protein
MATIANPKLVITHNHAAKTAKCVVTCNVNFTPYEVNEMKEGLKFKLKCELWGDDSGLTGSDDKLFTYSTVKYFPDATPASTENITFDVTLGEGVLDEDGFFGGFTDEVYGKLRLTNLYTLTQVTAKTNVASHSF